MGKMKVAVICAMLFMLGMALRPPTATAAWAEEGEPQEYWYCGDSAVRAIRRTVEKESSSDYWEVFRVQVGVHVGPRRIVLTYDRNTDRLMLNGKRCRQFKKEEKEP
jgi:hypothetical protein